MNAIAHLVRQMTQTSQSPRRHCGLRITAPLREQILRDRIDGRSMSWIQKNRHVSRLTITKIITQAK